MYQGEADVLVCEGFVGNVVLKVSEGMADMMLRKLAQDVTEHGENRVEVVLQVDEDRDGLVVGDGCVEGEERVEAIGETMAKGGVLRR